MTYPGQLGDWYTKLWHPENTFQFFLFQLHFNKNMLNSNQSFHNDCNYFKIPRQKGSQKRKVRRQKDVDAKEEVIYKSVFIQQSMS